MQVTWRPVPKIYLPNIVNIHLTDFMHKEITAQM